MPTVRPRNIIEEGSMGILKLIFNANNAEGIREAMRITYRQHRKRAERGTLPSDFCPHISGLLGAMGSRMAVNGLPVTPVALWHEVAPFALIADEEVAVWKPWQSTLSTLSAQWTRRLLVCARLLTCGCVGAPGQASAV
jgi:hypothetical protein